MDEQSVLQSRPRGGVRRPAGREEVTEAVIAAAHALFADRNPAKVPLREIAEKAGVNFGLVYQYVGSKEQLVVEVLQRTAVSTAQRLKRADSLEEALQLLTSGGETAIPQMVAWSLLEGREPSALFTRSPALTVLAGIAFRDAQRAGRDVTHEESQLLAAFVMVQVMGWHLFGEGALVSAGLDPDEKARYDRALTSWVHSVASASPTHVGVPPPPAAPADPSGAAQTTKAGELRDSPSPGPVSACTAHAMPSMTP